MKFFHKITALALSLTASLIMVGCGGGSTSSTTAASTTDTSTTPSSTSSSTIGQGKLSILLTDAAGDYAAVYVTIAEIHVHRAGTEDESNENDSDDGEWIVIDIEDTTYNLLELQNGVTVPMADEVILAGKYTQLRLILGSKDDGKLNMFGEKHESANYIVLTEEENLMAYALKVPSNTVKYNHNFTILNDEVVEMIIDFDADKSIHPAGDKWILNPVLKVTTELQ